MFDYDAHAPLDVEIAATQRFDGALICDLSFASPRGERVTAFLVTPAAPGRTPAVVFQHWGFGDRGTFLSEALAYAGGGVASLLVDAPGAGSHGGKLPRLDDPQKARAFLEQCVTNLRRGVDLLAAREDVDPARLAYVGFSLGASVGGQLAGAEPRIRAHVLMGGHGELSRGWAGRSGEAYAAAMRPLDGVRHIGQSRASFYFQFATRDVFIPPSDAQQFYDAAPNPKHLAWYDADHAFGAEALRDRARWLMSKLGVELPGESTWLESVAVPERDVARFHAALKFIPDTKEPAGN